MTESGTKQAVSRRGSPDVDALVNDPRRDQEIAQEMERVERKPPTYKVFRRVLYGLYGLVTLWLTLSIAISAWQSIYGERGRSLRQSQEQTRPVTVKDEAAPR